MLDSYTLRWAQSVVHMVEAPIRAFSTEDATCLEERVPGRPSRPPPSAFCGWFIRPCCSLPLFITVNLIFAPSSFFPFFRRMKRLRAKRKEEQKLMPSTVPSLVNSHASPNSAALNVRDLVLMIQPLQPNPV